MPFRPTIVTAILVSTTVCGCSAGFINEDGPGWSLADKPPVVSSEQRNGVSAAALEAALPPKSGTGGREVAAAASTPNYDYKGGRDPVTGKATVEGPDKTPAAVPAVRKVKATTEPARAAIAPPSTTTPVTAAAAAGGQIALVARGDTLHALSLKHRVTVKAIMSANSLTNTTIFPGQKLIIPSAPR